MRYSQTENFADPDPRLVALRLTADVIADIGSRPPWQDLSIPQFMVALCAAAGDGSRPARYNRAATELLHRLGSSLDQRVTGPLVIHATPDADGIVASLSDGQLQCLMSHLDVVNRSIYGQQPLLAAV